MVPQRRERLPALRAAVPAIREIPEHLQPRQARVIPPPRPRPRAALLSRGAPPFPVLPAATSGIIIAAGRRPRPRLLRRPPEQHPLQHSEVSPEPLQLGVPLRITLSQPRHLLPQQRVVLDQPVSQLRQLPVRLQGLSQHALRRRRLSTLRIPDHASRNRHAAQQTRSATANHAPRASVSQPAGPWDADDSVTGFPSTYGFSTYPKA